MYPTSSTFTGVQHDLLAVALYIYPIYYNNTLFTLFFTMIFSILPNVTILVQLMCCLFSFRL